MNDTSFIAVKNGRILAIHDIEEGAGDIVRAHGGTLVRITGENIPILTKAIQDLMTKVALLEDQCD